MTGYHVRSVCVTMFRYYHVLFSKLPWKKVPSACKFCVSIFAIRHISHNKHNHIFLVFFLFLSLLNKIINKTTFLSVKNLPPSILHIFIQLSFFIQFFANVRHTPSDATHSLGTPLLYWKRKQKILRTITEWHLKRNRREISQSAKEKNKNSCVKITNLVRGKLKSSNDQTK